MAMALTLQQYLDDHKVRYDVLVHQPSMTARQTARVSEIPADHLAKAVVMRDGQGYIVAVLPASCQLDKAQLWRLLHRPVEFASEDDAGSVFGDCARGAIPALSQAYGVEPIVDERLDRAPEIWLEAGDHERLVHLSGEQFHMLMTAARHGSFTHT